jgi:tetratricopeptide (TPR) repeat protein
MKVSRLIVAGLILALWPVMGLGTLPGVADQIKEAEEWIDSALWELEQQDELAEALERYQAAAAELESLEVETQSPDYREQQRVLAYAYLRIGNVLRQLGRSEEALQAGEKELGCARESGNDIALGRTLMNFGTTLLTGGQVEKGLAYIEQSRPIFEKGESFDHRQGLGWYWILQAELGLAGLTKEEPQNILGFLDTALEILEPIENWAGVARVYGLRAKVHESQGRTDTAAADRKLQAEFQFRVDEEMEQ